MLNGVQAVLIYGNYLPGLNIAQQPSSYGIKSHRFGSQDIIAVELANAQRPYPHGIAGSYEAIAGSDDQGIAPV